MKNFLLFVCLLFLLIGISFFYLHKRATLQKSQTSPTFILTADDLYQEGLDIFEEKGLDEAYKIWAVAVKLGSQDAAHLLRTAIYEIFDASSADGQSDEERNTLTQNARKKYSEGLKAFEKEDFDTAWDKWTEALKFGSEDALFKLRHLIDIRLLAAETEKSETEIAAELKTAHDKFIEGLESYRQKDYQKAQKIWTEAAKSGSYDAEIQLEEITWINQKESIVQKIQNGSPSAQENYIIGLEAFNQDDYETAWQAWMQAYKLGNNDAKQGLIKLSELLNKEFPAD